MSKPTFICPHRMTLNNLQHRPVICAGTCCGFRAGALRRRKVFLFKRRQGVHLDRSWVPVETAREESASARRRSFLPVSLRTHVHPRAVFPACLFCRLNRLLRFSNSIFFFSDVLEKTVEGEAAALTQAKTLYKSCTNERKSAGPGQEFIPAGS